MTPHFTLYESVKIFRTQYARHPHRPFPIIRACTVLLDTPLCRLGCLRKLAQTSREQVQTPRGEAEWCLDLLEGSLGAKTTRQAQIPRGEAEWYFGLSSCFCWPKQRDKPKYHEAKPSGIWAYRAVLAASFLREPHPAERCIEFTPRSIFLLRH